MRGRGLASTEVERFGKRMGLLAVAAFILLGWSIFDGILEGREDPNSGLTAEAGASGWVLQRNHSGHYYAPGFINGKPVRFLLDTGATQVAIPASMGGALGLVPRGRARVLTANGQADVQMTEIESLELGPFRFRSVSAHLSPGMAEGDVLLGMSVLKHLEFAQRGGTLVLTAPKSR